MDHTPNERDERAAHESSNPSDLMASKPTGHTPGPIETSATTESVAEMQERLNYRQRRIAELEAQNRELVAACRQAREMICRGTHHPDEYVSVLTAALARVEQGGGE